MENNKLTENQKELRNRVIGTKFKMSDVDGSELSIILSDMGFTEDLNMLTSSWYKEDYMFFYGTHIGYTSNLNYYKATNMPILTMSFIKTLYYLFLTDLPMKMEEVQKDNKESNESKYLTTQEIEDILDFAESELNFNTKVESESIEDVATIAKEEIITQLSAKKYLVSVVGGKAPKHIHNSLNSAEKEAKRLASLEIGKEVTVLEYVKSYQAKVIVEEI